MRHLAVAGWALAGLLSIPLPALSQDEPAAAQIPEALQPAVAAAERTGRLLQRLDRAAWVATDAIQGDRAARRLRRAVRGWITVPTDVGTRVSFFDDAEPARPLYVVDVEQSGRHTSRPAATDETFGPAELAMIRARTAAMSQSFLQCSRTYNSVVFAADDGIHVYLMPGTTNAEVHPAGGHHLFVYDAEGRTLQSQRGFTRGCIDLQSSPGRRHKGFQPTMMMVTHLLDPQPTEIHVFISLNAPLPLMVATASGDDPEKPALWAVERGRISLFDAGSGD